MATSTFEGLPSAIMGCTVSRNTMPTAKEHVRDILDHLGDEATLEDVQYHIYVRQKIARADEDIAAGRLYTQEEVKERMAQWLNPSGGPQRP